MISQSTFEKNNRLRQLSSYTDLLEKMHTAIDHSMDGIALLNAKGEYYYLNDVHLTMFGYGQEEELLGKTWQYIYGDAEIERINDSIFPLLMQKGKWKGETIGKSKAGTSVFQEITLSLMEDGGFICICRDISLRLLNQKKLLLHDSILQYTNSIVIITDINRNIEWVNDSFCGLTGYTVDEVTGKNPGQLLQGKHSDAATIKRFKDAISKGESFSSELLNYKKDGTPYWIEIKCQPLLNENGEVEKYFAIEENITGRKQKEQELFENNLRLELAIEGAQGALWDWDIRNSIMHYSISWKKQLGCLENEISNSLNEWTSRIHPDDLQKTLTILDNHLTGKTNLYEAELRLQHKSGMYLHFLDRGKIIEWDENGKPARMMGVAFHISALKESQEKYKTILDASGAAIWEWDIQKDKVIVNDKLARMYGFANAAEMPESFTFLEPLTHPDDREKMEHEVAEHMKGNTEGFDLDYRYWNTTENKHEWFNIKGAVTERTPEGFPLKAVGSCYNIQQRKETEDKLRESEKRLNHALEASGNGVWETNLETGVTIYSIQWKRMLGYDEQEISNSPSEFSNRIHPEDRAFCRESFTRYISGETDSYECQQRLLAKDGTYIWTIDRAIIIERDSNGKPLRVVGTNINVTALKLAEQKLKQNEERWRKTVEATGAGIGEIDFKNRKFWYSKKALELIGYTSEDEIPDSLDYYLSLIHPDDKKTALEKLNQHIMGLVPAYEYKYRVKNKNGEYRWFDFKGKVMDRDRDGTALNFIGSSYDITESKIVEEQLKENEQKMRLALNSVHGGLWENDVSKQLFHLYDLDPQTRKKIAATTLTWNESLSRIHPDDLDTAVKNQENFLNGLKSQYETEYRFKTDDGTYMWLNAVGNTVEKDTAGNPVRIIGIFTDVTERKTAEEKLKESEQRWNFALEGSGAGVWQMDFRTHTMWISDRGFQLMELKRTGNSLIQFADFFSKIHPQDIPFAERKMIDLLKGTIPRFELQVRYVLNNGEYKWLELHAIVSERDSDGRTVTLIGSSYDITDQKLAEEKVKHTEQQLQAAIEGIEAGIYEWDIIHEKYYYSDTTHRMFGVEKESLPYNWRPYEYLTHPDDAEKVKLAVDQLLTEGKKVALSYRMKKSDGSYIWVKDYATAVEKDQQGRAVKVIGTFLDITREKEYEEKLKESEKRLQLAITNSESGLWEWDTQTKLFKISDNSRKLIGITKGSFETVSDFTCRLHPEDADRALLDLQNHFEKKTDSYISEYRILDDSGNYRWLLSKGKLIAFGEDGAPLGVFLGTFSDITHSKEIEMKLKENEQKMRMALNSVHGGLWENDLEIDMYYLYELDKQTRKKINSFFMHWEDLVSRIHPDDIEKATAERISFLNGQTAQYETEYRFKTDDGSYMWINAVGSIAEKDINGKPSKTVGIFTDVTERKLAEEKLKENEQRWNFALEGAGAGVFDINFITGSAYYSRKLKDILGYTEEEFPDSFDEWQKLVHPDDYETVRESLDKFINGEVTTYQTEQRALHKDGHCMWFSNKVYLVRTPDGKPERMIGTIIEITESKRIQIELQRSKDLAEASVRSKQLFLANISHELRTPMHAIIGIGEQLSKSELADAQKEQLNVIHESANFLLSIIDDILDLSKIEEGKMRFEEYPFTLTAVVTSCFNLVKEKAEAKGLRISSNLDELFQQTFYLGDANRIKQIFLNILSNAVKFTEKGFITFNCKLIERELNQHTISITCIDTGIGIGEQMMQRLFQDFSQEDESFIRKYGGTGLGLSITKNLVEMMGGTIAIDSHKSVGTTVTIHLSFRIAEKNIEKETAHNHAIQQDTALLKNRKILVAEDNKFNRLLLKIIFDKYNIELTEAQNGKEAIELAAAGDFDMILMDIQMPEMDGVEATKYIRQVLKKDIPILAITANAVTEELEEYKAQGMDDALTKPFEEKNLLEKLFRFIIK